MNTELHLRIMGILLIALGLSHAFFPKWFSWKSELAKLSMLNRQIFVVHSFFIAMIVTMMGVLAFCYSSLLMTPSPMRNVIVSGLVVFWGFRLVFQFFVYDRQLWLGNPLRTIAHVAVSLFWTYLVLVFGSLLLPL